MPTPTGGPSMTDVLARQALAVTDQINAMRTAIDAIEGQANALLECVRALQDVEAQRIAAATVRVAAQDERPNMPPVFGRASPSPNAADAPPLPAIPPHVHRGIAVPSTISEVSHDSKSE